MAASDDVETITFTIESPAGDEDEVTIPRGLVELLAEGDQPPAEVVGDIAMLSFAGRAHQLEHHGEDVEADVEAEEARIMDLFRERFGVSFGEATGHQH